MSSPAKRRKKNDPDSSQQTRSIESFFKGQATKQAEKAEKAERTLGDIPKETDQTVSDEALARKLQAEWDQEDNNEPSAPEVSSDAPRSTPPIPNGDVIEPAAKVRKKNTLSLQSSSGTEDTISLSIPFDQSPLTFDSAKYAEELQAHWAAEGGDASYALLTRAFVLANSTTSRIKIVDTLVNFL